jgi:hypothetical protein
VPDFPLPTHTTHSRHLFFFPGEKEEEEEEDQYPKRGRQPQGYFLNVYEDVLKISFYKSVQRNSKCKMVLSFPWVIITQKHRGGLMEHHKQ